VVAYLLQTEIVPLCLRIMDTGSDLSKTVATFIVQKILSEDSGLNYMVGTPERFFAVSGNVQKQIYFRSLLCLGGGPREILTCETRVRYEV